MKRVIFSDIQLQVINKELQSAWRDRSIGFTSGQPETTVMASDLTTDVFLRIVRAVADGDDIGKETRYIRITFEGETDYDPQRNMYFKNVADKVYFFNTLFPVKYE